MATVKKIKIDGITKDIAAKYDVNENEITNTYTTITNFNLQNVTKKYSSYQKIFENNVSTLTTGNKYIITATPNGDGGTDGVTYDIFNIADISGGGSGVTVTTLWSGSQDITSTLSLTLSQNVSNFKYVEFVFLHVGVLFSQFQNVAEVADNSGYLCDYNDLASESFYLSTTLNNTTFTSSYDGGYGRYYLVKINGIK